MSPYHERPLTITHDMVEAVDAAIHGEVSRSHFLRRAALLGLSPAAISAVLAAYGSGASSALAAPAQDHMRSPVAAVEKIVYPAGLASIKNFNGPNGSTTAAVLPDHYYSGVDKYGIRQWKFLDFKADKPYRLAFAHFSAKWDLSIELTKRAKRDGAKIGCSVSTFDNNFDADQAIKNADLIVQQRFDFAYFAQIFPQANKAIFRKLEAAGIPSAYLAVEAPGEPQSIFIDEGNYRMFYALGQWLGNYAKKTWGGKVDLVILGAQPRAGKYVAEREVGFIAGLKSVLPNLPSSIFKTIDTQGVLDLAQKQTADLLTSNPQAKYILGSGTNDDTGVGIVRALQAAKRDRFAAVCGQAGQQSAIDELKKPTSPFKVSAFVDIEGWIWALAIGALKLMGGNISYTNLIPIELTTRQNLNAAPKGANTLP